MRSIFLKIAMFTVLLTVSSFSLAEAGRAEEKHKKSIESVISSMRAYHNNFDEAVLGQLENMIKSGTYTAAEYDALFLHRLSNIHINNFFIDVARNGEIYLLKRLLTFRGVDPTWDGSRVFTSAAWAGEFEVIRILLADKRANPAAKDISGHSDDPIRAAAKMGFVSILKLFLADDRVSPQARESEAIRRASSEGHIEIVKLLLEDGRSDPSAKDNEAIIHATMSDHSEIVSLLLKDSRVDPTDRGNSSFFIAARNGSNKTMRLLLKDQRIDPSIKGNLGLSVAASTGGEKTVKLLLEDLRVQKAMTDKQRKEISSRFSELVLPGSDQLDERSLPFKMEVPFLLFGKCWLFETREKAETFKKIGKFKSDSTDNDVISFKVFTAGPLHDYSMTLFEMVLNLYVTSGKVELMLQSNLELETKGTYEDESTYILTLLDASDDFMGLSGVKLRFNNEEIHKTEWNKEEVFAFCTRKTH